MYFFGVDMALVTEASRKDALKVVAGAAVSAATHIAGHYVFAEVFDVDVKQNGFSEEFTTDSESDRRWAARGGFILQHAVNLGLTSFETTRYSYFTKGYTITTSLQTWTYPLRHPNDGDFKTSDAGMIDYYIFSALSTHNMLRIPWERDNGETRIHPVR
jgi:hypothetical protein